MTDGNYARFLKILGKLCYTYDNSAGLVTAQQQAQYRTMEQTSKADQEFVDLPEIAIIAQQYAAWTNAITNGPTALQALMITTAKKLLQSDDFTAALTAVPASGNVSDVVTAWNTDFGTNSKTLTTLASTGLVNFILQVSTVTITHTSGSPTYADGTYVVLTIV